MIPPEAAAAVTIRDLSMSFTTRGREERVLEGIALEIHRGEAFVLLGPSGCGKSTLLRLVAGFFPPTAGEILAGATPVRAPGRDRGMVFQSVDASLFDWLNVVENIEFGLRMTGAPLQERRKTAQRLIGMVGLTGHERKFPRELSGGMKQRVQIARALSVDPAVLLMDEPFAALDAQTRKIMQREIVRIWTEVRKTIVYVTHDIREALLLGQRVAVMTAGPAARIKSVYDVAFAYPRDETTAEFGALFRQIERDIEEEVTTAWARGAMG
jgi:NitT/TauT family transport system ATP-binding protein